MRLLMNSKNEKQRKTLGAAFYWLSRYLGLDHIDKDVKLAVVHSKPKLRPAIDGNRLAIQTMLEYGWVDGDTEQGIAVSINLWRLSNAKDLSGLEQAAFEEFFRRTPKKDPLSTLCHEMTHVKQLAEGRLKRSKKDIFWEGKSADTFAANDLHSFSKYQTTPWEVEADAGEVALFPLLVKYLKENGYDTDLT